MKIHEYNQMMNYLTRKSPPERTGLAKGTTSDTKVTPKKAKILEYIDDNIAMYEPDIATKEQLEGLEKRLANARAHVTPEKKKMSKQDEYNTYFNKKSPKYYKAEKPEPAKKAIINTDLKDITKSINDYIAVKKSFERPLIRPIRKDPDVDKGIASIFGGYPKKYI